MEKKQRLSDMVTDELLAMIRNEYPTGSRIPTEDKLCKMFSVSRVTIREAVTNLKSKGILEVRQGDGTYVKSLSPLSVVEPLVSLLSLKNVEIEKIYDVRILIEVKAAGICAEIGLSDEDTDRIVHLMDEMNQMAIDKKIYEYNKLDLEFHKTIVRCSGNEILYTINELLLDLTEETIQKTCNRLEHLVDSLVYHNKIFQAIKDGDKERAEKAMREHIEGGLNFIRNQNN